MTDADVTGGESGTLVEHGGAVRALAERWLAEQRDAASDVVHSPAGLWLALAAVAAGAEGDTADELRALLGVAGEEAAAAATGVARELAGTDALGVATGVWSRVPVYRAFRESLPDIGFGPLQEPEAIDAWVRDATDGLIERLPVRVAADTLLVLVNALLLKARWETPFEGSSTHDRPFTDAAGVAHAVPTMHGSVPLGDAWRAPAAGGDEPVEVVQLRCATETGGLPAVVRFVLGPEGAPAGRVLPAAWAGPERRTGLDAEQVVLALPRLALRGSEDLLPRLRALGMRTAGTRAADFSRLSPEPLRISEVVQECVLRVAERGVEAAAVTAVAMRAGSAYRPRRVHAVRFDRPFGVVVLDGSGTVPLFTAWQASAPAAG
ncbi:serpin family protein [Streptomyces sp. B6B3]|uniref:serpin family protein n=1 Tax=Streptomyces sp. B6B3 TaxID=3153570 RepID=UPI00325C422B